MILGALPHLAVGRRPGWRHVVEAARGGLRRFNLPPAGRNERSGPALVGRAGRDALLVTVAWLVTCSSPPASGSPACAPGSGSRSPMSCTCRARWGGRRRLAMPSCSPPSHGLLAVACSSPAARHPGGLPPYAGIRATYCRRCGRWPGDEIGGYVEAGTPTGSAGSRWRSAGARRAEPELLELQYAALIHDIGQLSLHDPIPGAPPSWSPWRTAADRGAGRRGHPAGRHSG